MCAVSLVTYSSLACKKKQIKAFVFLPLVLIPGFDLELTRHTRGSMHHLRFLALVLAIVSAAVAVDYAGCPLMVR